MSAAVAAHAASVAGRAVLAGWRLPPAAERARECALLDEAIRREGEPEVWCRVGEGTMAERLAADPGAPGAALDGPALVEVLGWLEAARDMNRAWREEKVRARYPGLAERVDTVPDLEALRRRLSESLEPDGRVRDDASPALTRARTNLAEGERRLERQLERWAHGFGETSYVTRHGDRFVVLVPAAGFPRRRGIVHDVSGSGQSLFVEPLEACESNNRLIELRAAALDEEQRILRELAAATRAAGAALSVLEQVLVHLDTLRARARWARAHGAVAVTPGGERLLLREARHPLLLMGERREAVVPLDLELGPGGRVLLVSGPNMGGKTVLLKTVGLAVVLSHAGFPVPAGEGSAVPEFDCVLVDLGDEQSVERGLSTFAAHLGRLATMAEQAGPRSLLLCDELGAGTDPEEGAALGRALVEHFVAHEAWSVVTTHLGSLKRVSGEVPGVVNGSLEFDLETLTPRFRFIPGVPGASHALAVAGRLGFPRPVLERAEALTPGETRALERLLAALGVTQRRLDEETLALAAARREAEAAAAMHREATENSRRTLEELRRRLTRESESLLARARELWQTVQREARRAEKSRADAGRLREQIGSLEREADALGHGGETAAAAPPPAALRVGQRVRVTDLGIEAEVASEPDAEGRVQLRHGSWSVQSHVSRLTAAGSDEAGPAPPAGSAIWEMPEQAPPLELNLRGLEVEEALRALDQALDRAVLAGLAEIRIVHGIGRGVLRAAVERHLRDHPQIASQRMGVVGEGGRGVTVARLR